MARYRSAKNEAAYKRRKNPRTNESGQGYSKSRRGSRHSFEIVIDHRPLDKSIEAARNRITQALPELERAFKDAVKGFPVGKVDGLNTTVLKRKGDLGKAVATIKSRLESEKFLKDLYDNYAPEVGRMAVDNIRYGIKNPENDPISFRYETALMFNSVRYHKSRKPGQIVIKVGWLDTFRKYFDFQERGTQYLGAMNAITSGYRRSIPKAYRMMRSFLTDYTHVNGFNKRYKK